MYDPAAAGRLRMLRGLRGGTLPSDLGMCGSGADTAPAEIDRAAFAASAARVTAGLDRMVSRAQASAYGRATGRLRVVGTSGRLSTWERLVGDAQSEQRHAVVGGQAASPLADPDDLQHELERDGVQPPINRQSDPARRRA
jgi:hypothetical protein